MTILQPFILKITSPPYESENSHFQLTFSTITVFSLSLKLRLTVENIPSPFQLIWVEKGSTNLHFPRPWSSEAERIQMHQSGQPFTFDLKICIALFSNERSEAEWIKKAARRLVHQLRGRHPEGFIRSNPIEHLVKKPLSLLEHATDEGIHNEFRNRSCKCGQWQQLCRR